MSVSLTVSVAWLKEQVQAGAAGIKIVDGTWHLPLWKRNSQEEYLSQHIPGAVKFNTDEIADKSAPLPRTPPSVNQFEEQVGQLGISNDDHVIVYDNNSNLGMFSAPRVWFMFKLYGHEHVSILDGGLPKWIAEGGPVESGPPNDIKPVKYTGKYHKELHRTFEETLEHYKTNPSMFLDARPPGRYNGKDPEPNPKIPSGHIIGTKNLFWRNFIDTNTKTFKSPDEIQKVFTENGVNLDDPNIASCGGGISACWIAIAAFACGKTIPVYTGSWLDWYKQGPADTKVLGVKGEDL
jgi:thiosulfate/3-mercaptopyruvate sulfurtransferase